MRFYSIPCGIILLAMLAAPLMFPNALAQAPTEERRHAADPLLDAQQRVEFARNASVASDDRLKRADEVLKASDTELQAAQKQLEQVRARHDKAKKELADARAKAAAAKKDYEGESAALDRIRRGQKSR